jgi:excisionase family DNA binding protein
MTTREAPQPTDDEVTAIVDLLRSWRYVTPEQRTALRGAVAMLPLIEHQAPSLPPLDRGLRVTEVAEVLRVSPSSVRTLVRTGALRSYRLSSKPGSAIRVPESSVREWLATAGAA